MVITKKSSLVALVFFIAGLPAMPARAQLDIPGAVLAEHETYPDCDPIDKFGGKEAIDAALLSGNYALYMVPCFTGAYNVAYAIYVGDKVFERYSRLYFADYSDQTGWSGTPVLVNVSFDPASLELSSLYKSRGLGDCGSTGLWVWQESDFKLVEFRAKDECDATVTPENFPIIYQAGRSR